MKIFVFWLKLHWSLLPRVLLTLTHWGRVTHVCVGNLTIIGSDNGLLPGRRQAIIWTTAWTLLIKSLVTSFSEIFNQNSVIFIQENAFENVVSEAATIFPRPQCVNWLSHHWFRHGIGLAPNRFQDIVWTSDDPILCIIWHLNLRFTPAGSH